MEKLTKEEILTKAAEISKAMGGAKVHPFVFEENEDDGQVIGFLREPNLQTKLRALDSMGVDNLFSTGANLLESLLIKEYSDERITSGRSEYDSYYMGAATEALSLIKAAQNQLKKK